MLSNWDVGVVAQAFGLGTREVNADAALLNTSRRASLDDAIALFRERHNWSAMTAYRYLRTLRTALHGGPISL